jgi:Trk-type K+ transport system membrane component
MRNVLLKAGGLELQSHGSNCQGAYLTVTLLVAFCLRVLLIYVLFVIAVFWQAFHQLSDRVWYGIYFLGCIPLLDMLKFYLP